MFHSSGRVSRSDLPNCRYGCSVRFNSNLSSWWGVLSKKSLSVLSQLFPWLQVNLDPVSFDIGAGAVDAAQEAAKRGGDLVAPLRAGLPTDCGEAQSSVLAAAGAVVRKRWWLSVRVLSCVVVVFWSVAADDAVTLGQKVSFGGVLFYVNITLRLTAVPSTTTAKADEDLIKLDVRGSVHHSTIHKEKSNKLQQCIRILLFNIYMKLNMFWATHRPSPGA